MIRPGARVRSLTYADDFVGLVLSVRTDRDHPVALVRWFDRNARIGRDKSRYVQWENFSELAHCP